MARWKFILMHAVKGYGGDRCSSFAAAIAYFALLSLFPLSMFAVALAGYFLLARDPANQERIINTLMENLPLSGDARDGLQKTIGDVARARGGIGLIGLIGAAYSASALFGALRTALNAVFRVDRPQPMLQGKMLDLGMVFGLGALLMLSMALTGVLAFLRKFSGELFGDFSMVADILFTIANVIIPTAISLGIFMIVYKTVPHAELEWRDVLPGALLAAIGFEVLKLGFASYVSNFGNYDAVYGTLATVIVFLIFAYFTAQIVLFGAEFTRSYMEVMSGTVPAAQPAVPKRPVSLPKRVEAMVKGLFVSAEPHHDHRLPYAPAKKAGPLTDAQAEQKR